MRQHKRGRYKPCESRASIAGGLRSGHQGDERDTELRDAHLACWPKGLPCWLDLPAIYRKRGSGCIGRPRRASFPCSQQCKIVLYIMISNELTHKLKYSLSHKLLMHPSSAKSLFFTHI